jgi:hypothetical protein
MRSRLDDLLANGARQLASESYEAAIDTYRTALGEQGASEAGVEELLESACRRRDEARGIVPPPEPVAAPALSRVGEPVESPAAAPAEQPPQLEPDPVPQTVVVDPTIEPPRFLLAQDAPSILEECRREPYHMEVERLSILNPKPLTNEFDPASGTRAAIGVLIFIALVAAGILVRFLFP